jgi:hypothetical protein
MVHFMMAKQRIDAGRLRRFWIAAGADGIG